MLEEFHHVVFFRDGSRTRLFTIGRTFGVLETRARVARRSGRAIAVMSTLEHTPGLTLSELARRLGIPKSGAKWQVDRLERLGLLTRTKGRNGHSLSLNVPLAIRGAQAGT
ncbi:MAG: MarR family transcriptional regulator [Euryarchaeota archaeon]|nr:MarR family transcriptional regulator [Euryarchaeota archaeon]